MELSPGGGSEPVTRYLGMKPDEMAAAFTAWAAGEGILARVAGEQCEDLAKAFMAGCVYAARLTGDEGRTEAAGLDGEIAEPFGGDR
jgi:hypothetical protein